MESRVLSTAPSRINVYGGLRGNSRVNLSDVMPRRRRRNHARVSKWGSATGSD